MTIRDFIAAYNKTFEYIETRYGADALKDLWAKISREWCTHLAELASEKGLEGLLEYWGGASGTLSREKAFYEVGIKDGVFRGDMAECPSVADLRQRSHQPFRGDLSYCDHCEALYAPAVAPYGIDLQFYPDYREDGSCAGSCHWIARAGACQKPREVGARNHETLEGGKV